MRLNHARKRPLPKLSEEAQTNLFWNRLFGFKIGDIIRPKYGKCYWEIYSIHPEWDMVKVRRLKCDKYGSFIPEEITTTFWTWQIVEVQSKETVDDPFPSQVFR